MYEDAMVAEMERERQSLIQRLNDIEEEKLQGRLLAKKTLQEQIAQREKDKEVAYEQYLREKEMVDRMVKEIEQREYE